MGMIVSIAHMPELSQKFLYPLPERPCFLTIFPTTLPVFILDIKVYRRPHIANNVREALKYGGRNSRLWRTYEPHRFPTGRVLSPCLTF